MPKPRPKALSQNPHRLRERREKSLEAAIGREVRYVPVTAEAFGSELAAHGMPEADATHLAELLTEVLDGRSAHLADGVQRALGRAPRDFADYARDAAAAGAWGEAGTGASR